MASVRASDSFSFHKDQRGIFPPRFSLESSVFSDIGPKFHILLWWCLLPLTLWAQDSTRTWPKFSVVTSNLGPSHPLAGKEYRQFRKCADSLAVTQKAAGLAADLVEEGYLEFSLDSFAAHGDTLDLHFHTGPVYILNGLELDGLSEVVASKSNYDRMVRKKPPFDWERLQAELTRNLQTYENQGYPFAKFDSLEVAYEELPGMLKTNVSYQFDPGTLVTLDSVLIKGDVREKPEFIQGMVGLHAGAVFDQSAIDGAPRILNNSIYFRDVPPVKVDFVDEDKAKLTIEVKPRKSGKFDLLLGILPPRDESAKLEFTGLADFQLVSPLFRAGETVEFRYDKLVGSSQKLHLRYAQPYVFGSPLQVDADFDLLKQDTIFLTRYFRLSTAYAFNPRLSVRVYFKNKVSSLISTRHYDTLQPPPVLDGRDQTYGIGFAFQNLDYRISPRKGWDIRADLGIGRKEIIDNPTLDDRIYLGLERRLPKREAEFELRWFQSLSKRMVLMLGNHSYFLDQPQYFENDLIQVGGSRSIRGFDENQFFAGLYSRFTLENRFLLEQNSYLFVFTDYAYLENPAQNRQILRPWGIGLGLTYETKAGMVSVTYAAGRVAEFPFQPSRGRIHVGLVNQF